MIGKVAYYLTMSYVW